VKVLIYGGGAVGLGIGSCLLKSKADVDIIARQNTVHSLREFGLIRKGIFGSFHAAPEVFAAYSSLEQVPDKVYDDILICTKSFDSLTAAQDISRHSRLLGKQTKIVLFQNGWGNTEMFVSLFEPTRIYNARVITGFQRLEPNEVTVTVHADAIHIGALFGGNLSCVKKLCEFITEGDIPCQTTNDIEKDLWAKMLYNCALNPLGAIVDVPYGALAENDYTRELMNHIIEEAFSAMTEAGYQTHWQSAAEFLQAFYERLVPDTAEHKSSTLQDIHASKRTEIGALNGAVIKLAKQHEVAVPYNLSVYNIINFLEAKQMR